MLCYYLNFDDRTKVCFLNYEPSLFSKGKTSEKSGKKSERSETVDNTFWVVKFHSKMSVALSEFFTFFGPILVFMYKYMIWGIARPFAWENSTIDELKMPNFQFQALL